MLSVVAFERFLLQSDYIIYAICFLPTIVAYSTISLCYKTAFYYNRFPEWVVIPWISFTGVNFPESSIFGIGLSLAACCTYLMHYIFQKTIINNKQIINIGNIKNSLFSKIPYFESLISFGLKYNMLFASIGLSIQSWINLDNNILIEFFSPKMQTMKWYPNWSAFIHIFAAGYFFIAIFSHNVAVVLTFNKSLKLSYYFKLFIVWLSFTFTFIFFCSMIIVCYFINPYQHQTLFHFLINLIGLCQYIHVASDCAFSISYPFDYYITKKQKKC
eukprot:163967_1